MTAHAYTEDPRGEQPAIGLFAALGWQTVKALDETFGASAVRARLPVLSRTQRRGLGRGGLIAAIEQTRVTRPPRRPHRSIP